MDSLAIVIKNFKEERWLPYLLALTLLTMPLSSTGKSIFLALSILAILLTPSYRKQLPIVLQKPWCIAALLLFGVVILACLWSPATYTEQYFVVQKYSKLLYLPILAVGFTNSRTRSYSIWAFMLAILVTCLIAILKFHGYLQSMHFDPEHVFRNHIMTGFMVAFAAYLSLLMLLSSDSNNRNDKGDQQCATSMSLTSRFSYILLTAIYSYHILFVNGSRTGYVIYLLLMIFLLFKLCAWRQAIVGMCVVCCVFIFSYSQSTSMKERVNAVIQQIHTYNNKQDINSSIGFRLQFHNFADTLFKQHPLIGNGTGSFTYYFRTINPVPAWVFRGSSASKAHTLLEPHSQYWLVAAELGCLGFIVLAGFFYTLFRAIWHLKILKAVALGMLVCFLIGNLSDSLLFYSGSGYFFLLFMAICLGEQLEWATSTRN